jgi:uncharacterized protein
VRIIRFNELVEIPWKNGGGMTREMASLRRDDALVWRLSLADVLSDGPFSHFAGLTRILTVIEGNGMTLASPEETIQAMFGKPVTFDGGLPIESKLLNGPIRDLNLMFDPHLCNGSVASAHISTHLSTFPDAHRTIAVVGWQGTVMVNSTAKLGFGDVAMFESGGVELSISDNAKALIVTLDLIG